MGSAQTEELYINGYGAGFSEAMDGWAYPVGFVYKFINYYGYFTTPPFPLGDETIEERVERHKGIMHDVLPRMDEQSEEIEDPRDELVARLLQYKKYKDAACMLEERSRQWLGQT